MPRKTQPATAAVPPTNGARPPETEMAHAARELAEMGYHVLPLRWITSAGHCSCSKGAACSSPGKHPCLEHGHLDATTDPAQIRRWWEKWPYANVGIALAQSGLVDVAPDSEEWLTEFRRRGLPPDCLNWHSGGGEGHQHFAYRRPEGCLVARRCRSGEFDLLADGLVVVPPSLHASGRRYEWVLVPVPPNCLPPAPDWVVEELRGRGDAPAREDLSGDVETWEGDDPPVPLTGRAARLWSGEETIQGENNEVDRSGTLHAIMKTLIRAGATEEQAIAATWNRDDRLGYRKFCDRRDPQQEYAREYRHAEERVSAEDEETRIEVPWQGRSDGKAPSQTARDNQSLLFTLCELEKTEVTEQQWVVPGMIPRSGQTTLAGSPKCGKSLLVTQLAVIAASGGKFLDRDAVSEGDVLYLALEDTKRRLKSRLGRMFPAGGWPENCSVALEWRRLDQGGTGDIEEWLTKHPRANLVIIDTLGRVRPPRRSDAAIYDEDYALMARLQTLGRQYNVAILVVHHTRKMSADNPFDMISGTLGLNGAADSMLVLKRSHGAEEGTLYVTGREVEERELVMRFVKETLTWRALGDAAIYQVTQKQNEVIEALLRAGTPLPPKDLAERLGARNDSTFRERLRTMLGKGQLSQDDSGRYGVVPISDARFISSRYL